MKQKLGSVFIAQDYCADETFVIRIVLVHPIARHIRIDTDQHFAQWINFKAAQEFTGVDSQQLPWANGCNARTREFEFVGSRGANHSCVLRGI